MVTFLFCNCIAGNTFEYFLEKGTIQKHITILGATSGDTGSAALHGLRGKKNVNCFIMFPKGKVTDIQERQMTSILDSNVHCISIDVSLLESTHFITVTSKLLKINLIAAFINSNLIIIISMFRASECFSAFLSLFFPFLNALFNV